MKIIILGFIAFMYCSNLNAQNFKYPFKMDSIPKLKPQTKIFAPKSNMPQGSSSIQKMSNNLKNTGKKTTNGFDIYIADIDKMSILIPNTQNPNYIESKSSNGIEFK